MNPLTNMKNVLKLSENELGTKNKTSWHDQYRDSAWIFVGGLPYDLTEGDIICIFSQYGEIVNINLVRDKDTGKSKGFCFLCFEDQRSTVLSVDNFNGIKILGRIIRVDHVSDYKVPKDGKKTDEETKQLYQEGCAPKSVVPSINKSPPRNLRETLADQIEADIKLPPRLPIYPIKKEDDDLPKIKKEKNNEVPEKKKHKSKKKSKNSSSDEEEISRKHKHKRKKEDKHDLSGKHKKHKHNSDSKHKR
ncbi:RNA-binding motif protein, X-linked 2 [Diabrotica virgifera virgifera]|uniref:RNA-binding motif protein, X-linked 2 n=1 Tax=Diabrotica virgifera virgifera TaxID=50390 RepID=A0A6P7GAT4_DIAVI|nr:RNA-binding motif protein, X-linked 2 [Diabrotica virgifera virgifera]XP_050510509.1 RNA-binding motif protein, X-linked 2 [Diabrotica virgifera virgifera]